MFCILRRSSIAAAAQAVMSIVFHRGARTTASSRHKHTINCAKSSVYDRNMPSKQETLQSRQCATEQCQASKKLCRVVSIRHRTLPSKQETVQSRQHTPPNNALNQSSSEDAICVVCARGAASAKRSSSLFTSVPVLTSATRISGARAPCTNRLQYARNSSSVAR